MSETTNSTEATEIESTTDAAVDAPQDTTEAEGHEDAREAAKWRRKLREAEGQRDSLQARVAALQTAEVDRMAEAAKIKPAALWASGATLEALLADDGTVDAEKVRAAVLVARDALGIAPTPPAPPAWGQGKVGEPIGGQAAPKFADAFTPKH